MPSLRSAFVLAAVLATVLGGCLGNRIPAQGLDLESDDSPWAGAVVDGTYSFKEFARVLTKGTLKEKAVLVASPASTLDGAAIQIGVWRPDVPEGTKVPVIADAGPYYGPDLKGERSGHIKRLADNFVPHGFAVAAITVRGTGDHGGCMDLMGTKERHDLDQAVTWLGTQEWSNGKVALIGASYDGSTPFEVASMGNKHLATIVPVSGLTNIYELMYRNGTSEQRGPVVLNYLYYSYTFTTIGRSPANVIAGAVCPESWTGLAASTYSGVGGGYDPAGYWAERDSRPGLMKNYQGSILHIQGLQDWNVDPGLNLPWIDEFNRTGRYVQQWLGQWGHAFPDSQCSDRVEANTSAAGACRWDYAEHLLRWFDHWLRDNTSRSLGPAVQIADHDGNWRAEPNWPPRNANWSTLELSTEGALKARGQSQAGSVRLLPSGGQAALSPQGPGPTGYVEFRSEPMAKDARISGLPQVHVTVVPEGAGGILGAWLYREESGSAPERIGWTAINLRFADGTDEAKEVVPGQPLLARLEIQPMDAIVPAGSNLMLRLWQVPPGDRIASSAPGVINLEFGAEKSIVRIPWLDLDPSRAIEPPYKSGGD